MSTATRRHEARTRVGVARIGLILASVAFCAGARAAGLPDDNVDLVVQSGHVSSILGIATSPDGRLAITASADGTLKLWEIATGRALRTFRGHEGPVLDVAFSADGLRAVSVGRLEHKAYIWDVATGQALYTLPHEELVSAARLLPDGRHALTGTISGMLHLWDLTTGRHVREYSGHKKPVSALAVSRDGRWAISGSWDQTARIWNLVSHRSTAKIQHQGPVTSVAFAPDGSMVASASFDGRVRLSGVPSGALRGSLPHREAVHAVAFSERGDAVLTGSADGKARLWQLGETRPRRTFSHNDVVDAVAFVNGSRWMLAGGRGEELALWSTATGRRLRAFQAGPVKTRVIVLSADGRRAATVSATETLQLWDMETGALALSFPGHYDPIKDIHYIVYDLDLSADGRWMLSGGGDGSMRLWDVERGGRERVLGSYDAEVLAVKISRDGRRAVAAVADSTLRVWNLETRREERRIQLHAPAISLAISADGRRVATGLWDHGLPDLIVARYPTLVLWDITNGRRLQEIQVKGNVGPLAFGPGDATLLGVTISEKSIIPRKKKEWTLWSQSGPRPEPMVGTIARFDVKTGRRLPDVLSLKGFGYTFALSPDGRRAVTVGGAHPFAAADGSTVSLWDLETGARIHDFKGASSTSRGLGLSPDGRLVLTAGETAITVADVRSGRTLVRLAGSSDGEWVAVTPDGYYDSSPEGTESFFWVPRSSNESFSFEQFEARFHRPDVIRARLAGNPDAGRPAPRPGVPPRIEMHDPVSSVRTSRVSETLAFTARAHGSVSVVRVFVNGRPVVEIPVNAAERRLEASVPLQPGANRIAVVAWDDAGLSSNPALLDVFSTLDDGRRSDVAVVAVGVSRYPKLPEAWQLSHADTDAALIARAFEQQAGRAFGDVRSTLLENEGASKRAILDAIAGLSSLTPADLAVVFLAGHGVRSENGAGSFHFLTADAARPVAGPGTIRWSELATALSGVRARVLLFLDACHSGGLGRASVVANDDLARRLFSREQGGITVFSASKGRQQSFESGVGGAGLFSYAIARGLGQEAPRADADSNGTVELLELVDYVRAVVAEEVGLLQTPWLSRKELFGDIPLARIH